MESKKKIAISVLSGGLDSTVATSTYKDTHHIHALTFNYGQKSAEMEIKSAIAVCKEIGAKHTVIDLPWLAELGKSSLTSDRDIPEPTEEDLDDKDVSTKTAHSVWVPGRNIVFTSIANSFAESEGASIIIVGWDHEEAVTFPDNSKEFLSIILFVNYNLDSKTLVRILKSTIDCKSAALWDMGVINHFSFDPLDLEDNESIIVASTGSADTVSPELANELVKDVQTSVRQAVKNALSHNGYPKDVLEYMKDVGVEVDDLVDAGMELVVGVEETPEMREKLRKQIYHSLEDLNVVSFIIAGIRLEEDYEKHRVLGVDVDDDPAYLYSDEVFGMSVANQIAGTKAIFNFKRYDEAKPGIISKLGPVLDDIFAGLVAGCMSKIFEV